MISIVRNRQSRVNTTGFRRVTGEGRRLVSADGLAALAGERWRRVTDARGMTKQGLARLPGRGDAGRTELAERLLASQEKVARDVPRVTTPLLPRQGRHRRQEQRRPDQAGLTFPAGLPATCGGSTARRRAGRGSPQTCLSS